MRLPEEIAKLCIAAGLPNPFAGLRWATDANDTHECFGAVVEAGEKLLNLKPHVAEALSKWKAPTEDPAGELASWVEEACIKRAARERLNDVLKAVVSVRGYREVGPDPAQDFRSLGEQAQLSKVVAAYLSSMLLVAVWVRADGNCLFYALSLATHGTDTLHKRERKEVCEFMVSDMGMRLLPFPSPDEARAHSR